MFMVHFASDNNFELCWFTTIFSSLGCAPLHRGRGTSFRWTMLNKSTKDRFSLLPNSVFMAYTWGWCEPLTNRDDPLPKVGMELQSHFFHHAHPSRFLWCCREETCIKSNIASNLPLGNSLWPFWVKTWPFQWLFSDQPNVWGSSSVTSWKKTRSTRGDPMAAFLSRRFGGFNGQKKRPGEMTWGVSCHSGSMYAWYIYLHLP